MRVFEPAGQDARLHVRQAEMLLHVGHGALSIETLAREDVDPDEPAFREGVDGDMALSDEDESGDAPVLGPAALVPVNMRRRDLGHPDLLRVAIQERAHKLFVRQRFRVASVPVNRNVHQSPLPFGSIVSTNPLGPSSVPNPPFFTCPPRGLAATLFGLITWEKAVSARS